MGKPMRTNNPSEWTALDGIYIDELRPPGKISNLGSAVVAIIGQFQMGPYDATTIGSSKQLTDLFGAGDYEGFKTLLGKTFSNLVVKRVKGTGKKAAFGTLMDGAGTPANSITVTAKYEGNYGNTITAKTLAATSLDVEQVNILVTYGSITELFENVSLAKLSTAIEGDLAILTKADGATLPPATAQTITLTQGSDGTVATADYTTALSDLEAYDGLTIMIADQGTQDINLALIAHCNKMGDRLPILHLPKGTTKSQAITAIAQLRSAADRGILAWPWVYQYNMYKDVTELSNPAAWAASLISQIPEEWDPAIADGAKYVTGIKGLEFTTLNRQDYIELKNAGIMAWEFDKDIGYKIKSGITMSTDPVLSMVFRRRMSDKLTSEVAAGLKPYQNKPNTEDNQADALGAVTRYLQDFKDKKRIKNFVVDGDSMNTSTTLANGEFHILMMVQLYSSMRYIVLHAQVGETVLIVQEVNNNVG